MPTLLTDRSTAHSDQTHHCGILGLHNNDICTLQAGFPQAQAPIALIGAGNKLEEGFLIPQDGHCRVFPSQGGQAEFAPQDGWAYQILLHLRSRENTSYISMDHVISDRGIVSIYRCLRDDYSAAPESPALTAAFKHWAETSQDRLRTERLADAIAQHAIEGQDILSRKTMELFVQFYGAEAGNLALKLFPDGGLYIMGTIASKIKPLMEREGFLEAFLNKGRLRSRLEQIPVHIVMNSEATLASTTQRLTTAAEAQLVS
ncbi:MAG: glucokinase [Cyanobacteria bacterium P01_A01_bin.116]